MLRSLIGGRPESPVGPHHRRLIEQLIDEALAGADNGFKAPKIGALETGRKILAAAGRDRLLYALASLEAFAKAADANAWDKRRYVTNDALKDVIISMLRARWDGEEGDVLFLARFLGDILDRVYHLPIPTLLRCLETYAEAKGLSAPLRRAVSELHESFLRSRFAQSAEIRRSADRLARFLSDDRDMRLLDDSPWAGEVGTWLDTLDQVQRRAWEALIRYCIDVPDQMRPSERWQKQVEPLCKPIGAAHVEARIVAWLDAVEPNPERPDPNADAIRGLMWCLPSVEQGRTAFALGQFAEKCFKKIPNVGARSVKLGNACLMVLACLPGTSGVAQLTRLKGKIRYPSAAKKIDEAMSDVARRSGRSVAQLEELAVPVFDLDAEGSICVSVGDFEAIIKIMGTQTVELIWRDANGKERRSVPAHVKKIHFDQLKDIKRRAKEIEAALVGQVGRLERLFLEKRSWPYSEWRKLYADHPLLSRLARRLIWRFNLGGRTSDGAFSENRLVDMHGNDLDSSVEVATVRLWHPIDAAASDVLAWRRRLEFVGVVQPFKQAHREIYVLTDAERQTATYSNRFAAHILRQHQFRALCLQRGWSYQLQGSFDSHNVPKRVLGWLGLTVEYWVEPATDGGEVGIYAHVVTDQIRFVAENGVAQRLESIDPIVFSELLRDVDLFVAVCSVGNDPNWFDGGPEQRFQGYWERYAFGELSATAQTRRDVLQALLPRLKIADRCVLTDRFLVVRGTRRTYKIHLGSGNIMMDPNDQYLCIVPDRSQGAASDRSKVYLPFEGDGTLSIILSKAFLLANDQAITDPTILRQILPPT
jgi:hypothetical protein